MHVELTPAKASLLTQVHLSLRPERRWGGVDMRADHIGLRSTYSLQSRVHRDGGEPSSVIGSSHMPYLNSLASKYGLATQYYANTHPSLGNYFMLITGQIITNNDNFTGTVTVDNAVRQLLAAGKNWKGYAESLPSLGYLGGGTGLYVKNHNPFAYLSDVVNNSVQPPNIIPFSPLA